ncbi:MAG TPA: ATP-binding protein, partial [Flavobacterium sp.]|nr:ATP-binding protein [Flavobacterium sp.]
EDLEIAIREKNTSLQVHRLPTIPGIKGQLQQLFQNLISNALKFNDKKDPLIEISHVPVTQDMAEIFSILPERYTAISIRDNGIGFDEKFKERIFGIFQRLNGSQFEGTGIGLAICKKIVENHHGFIHVRSVPGQGTEFIIIMPAIARIGKEKKRTLAGDPGHHQSKNN